jgi:hypothetical protein
MEGQKMKYLYKDGKFPLNRTQILSSYKGERIMERFKKMQILVVRFFFIVATMTLGITSITYADGGLPYTFSSGQTISSAQVNANFQYLLKQIQGQQQASIVGSYTYYELGIQASIPVADGGGGSYTSQYMVQHWSSHGTLTFVDNGTFTITGTSGTGIDIEFTNKVTGTYAENNVTIPNTSLILCGFNSASYIDSGSGTYTVNGSNITLVGGLGTLTLSADGTLLVGTVNFAQAKSQIIIGIRQQ